MPQFNLYPLVSSFEEEDVFLFYDDSAGALQTITGEDLISVIKSLTNRAMDISVISSSSTLSDEEFIVCNSASTFTVTLPPTTDNPGVPFYLSNKGVGTVTVAATGLDTIAGAASVEIEQYQSFIFIPDGLGMWHKF
jgi:hypothetical protein